MTDRVPRLTTADGTNTAAFTAGDWVLLVSVAGIWGSSFLWIAIGLESLSATSVAFLRVTLGGLALAAFPSARRRVDRSAWPAIALIGIVGSAGPALLFALAQQHVESSVAGMINAATPLAVLLVSIAMLGRSPGPNQVTGLFIGFVGVALMAAPSLTGAEAQPGGVALLLVAVAGHQPDSGGRHHPRCRVPERDHRTDRARGYWRHTRWRLPHDAIPTPRRADVGDLDPVADQDDVGIAGVRQLAGG